MKYELKSRNITAAQKCAPDFHKSDTLAQTNQMKMTAFFFSFPWHRKHKKIIFSRSKIRNKNPGDIFLILYCSLISQ